MPRFSLRLQSRPRAAFLDDDGEGAILRDLVVTGVAKGAAPVVGVVVRTDRLDLIGLDAARAANLPVPLLLAGMTRSVALGAGPVEAVGVMGVVDARGAAGEPGVPMGLVFLEWADCRWWMWRGLVDPDLKAIREDSEAITRAVDGDPLPFQMGKWWSLGRRRNLRVELGVAQAVGAAPREAPLVH